MFIMIIGRPASGKSFKAAELKEQGFTVLSSDAVRAEKGYKNDNVQDNTTLFSFLRSEAARLLEAGQDVALDSTNTIAKYRKWFLDGLPGGIPKAAYFIDTPLELCIGRNALRTKGRVPEWAYRKKFMQIQPPSADEGFDRITVFKTVFKMENSIMETKNNK